MPFDGKQTFVFLDFLVEPGLVGMALLLLALDHGKLPFMVLVIRVEPDFIDPALFQFALDGCELTLLRIEPGMELRAGLRQQLKIALYQVACDPLVLVPVQS